jgi:NitT/TauT family transport system permease protein
VDGLAVVAVATVALVVFLDEPHVLPRTSEALNLSPAMLPLYAAYSLLRMLAAYALSLGFALGAGYWASASPQGRRLILPALDVLQAVPILMGLGGHARAYPRELSDACFLCVAEAGS